MIRKIIYILFLLILVINPSFAEKIPVKITPIQIISTHHDEVEIGDLMPFQVVNDVYVDGKLYLKKDTIIIGKVDFVHPNGWAGDSAEIWFNTFYIKSLDNKTFSVDSPLKIIGNSDKANNFKQAAAYLIIRAVRGAEIFIEPDTKVFNIFIER